MNCLRINQIYLYLEGELSPAENKSIEEHLSSCLICKKAVKERKLLLQASRSLPLWNTPPDFTQQVMTRIFPEKVSLRSLLTVMAAGSSLIFLTFLTYLLISDQNLADFLISLGQTLLNLVRNLSILFVKLYKLASLLVKIILQFSEFLLKGFASLTTILSPELQIILITFTLILSAFILFRVKKTLLTGERS